MPEAKNAEAIVALADSAIASADGIGVQAAVMLIDAALVIALMRLGGHGVDEMAGHLAEYIVRQASHVAGGAGHG